MDESTEDTFCEPKVETIVEETIIEETPLDILVSTGEARTIGQEGSTYVNEFTICMLKYRGQTSDPSLENTTIKSSSVDEFADNLFELVQPLLKRAIEFPTPNEPCWAEKEYPTKEDLPLYVAFKDRIQKRSWRMDQVDEHMLLRWAQRVLVLQVYIYSINIQSRPMWDIVTQALFATPNNIHVKRIIVTEGREELKLQAIIKRLKKTHSAHLVPKTDDAYKLWARFIIQKPARRHRDLCFSRPPKKLLQNFVIIGKKENSQRKPVVVPVQRDQSTDGFGFQDEVYALRQTVTQIKDLVEMLDRRVELLEEKCHGLRQTQEDVPKKKRRLASASDNDDSDDQNEPIIDDPSKHDNTPQQGESNSENPDPLLFNDMVDFVKQEYLESEADD